MSGQKRAEYLERATLRAAQAYARRHNGHAPTRNQLLELSIPSVEPWKRILLSTLGLAGIIGGTVFIVDGTRTEIVGGCFLIFVGLILLLIGALGRRRTINECLMQMGDSLANHVIEAVFRTLDGI